MDFLFSAEQEAFRQKVKAFAEKEIAPIADELDERREFPLHIFRKLGQVGFLGIRYPEEYGGMGADLVTLCIFREELTCSSKGITGGVGVHIAIGTYPIYKFGSELQKQKYLIPAIRGEKISAFGLTEPDAGSHVAAIQTRATKSGSSYIINGSKIFITNSPIADFITVATRTSEGKGIEGISLFLVERGTKGFFVGSEMNKLGIHSAQTAEVFFNDCRVSEENLVGELGRGLSSLKETLAEGRILVGATCVGGARAAFEETLNHYHKKQRSEREQVHRHMIADILIEIELAKLLVYKAAWLSDKGLDFMAEASMAKLYASTVGRTTAERTLRILGIDGYTRRFGSERFLRDSLIWEIGEGTSEIQHNIIAAALQL